MHHPAIDEPIGTIPTPDGLERMQPLRKVGVDIEDGTVHHVIVP